MSADYRRGMTPHPNVRLAAAWIACTAAAVMTPIGRLASDDFDLTVGDGEAGPVTTRIRAELTDIQYGRATDRHGWLHRLV